MKPNKTSNQTNGWHIFVSNVKFMNILPTRCSFILSKTGLISSRVRVFCPAKPLKKENSPPPRPEDLVLTTKRSPFQQNTKPAYNFSILRPVIMSDLEKGLTIELVWLDKKEERERKYVSVYCECCHNNYYYYYY